MIQTQLFKVSIGYNSDMQIKNSKYTKYLNILWLFSCLQI